MGKARKISVPISVTLDEQSFGEVLSRIKRGIEDANKVAGQGTAKQGAATVDSQSVARTRVALRSLISDSKQVQAAISQALSLRLDSSQQSRIDQQFRAYTAARLRAVNTLLKSDSLSSVDRDAAFREQAKLQRDLAAFRQRDVRDRAAAAKLATDVEIQQARRARDIEQANEKNRLLQQRQSARASLQESQQRILATQEATRRALADQQSFQAAQQAGDRLRTAARRGGVRGVVGGLVQGDFSRLLIDEQEGALRSLRTRSLGDIGKAFFSSQAQGVTDIAKAVGVTGDAAIKLASGFGLAATAASSIATYVGQAYSRTVEFTAQTGRLQRLLGQSAEDSARLQLLLQATGNADNVFATITLNQIQAAIQALRDSEARGTEPNRQAEEFRAGVEAVGIDVRNVKGINDFLLALSRQLENISGIERSRRIQEIAGLFGQDVANFAGFRPENLEKLLKAQTQVAEADLRLSEDRQIAYTLADNAVKNFELSLTRAVGPIDLFVQSLKTDFLNASSDVAEAIGIVSGATRSDDAGRKRINERLDTGFVTSLLKKSIALLPDEELREIANAPAQIQNVLTRAGQLQFDRNAVNRQQAQEELDRRRAERFAQYRSPRDFLDATNVTTAERQVAYAKSVEDASDALRQAKDTLKTYNDSQKELVDLQKQNIELNQRFASSADAGFRGLVSGAERTNAFLERYQKIVAELAKTPPSFLQRQQINADGTITILETAEGKGKKPPSALKLLREQNRLQDLQLQVGGGDQAKIDDAKRDLDIAIGKGKITAEDIARRRANIAQRELDLEQKRRELDIRTGGTGGLTQADGFDPNKVAVGFREVRIPNKKFKELSEEQQKAISDFNQDTLLISQQFFDEYSQKLAAIGASGEDAFRKLRAEGVDAFATLANRVDLFSSVGFVEQIGLAQIKLRLFKGEINFDEATKQIDNLRTQLIGVSEFLDNPKRLTQRAAIEAGLLTPVSADISGRGLEEYKQQREQIQREIDEGTKTAEALRQVNANIARAEGERNAVALQERAARGDRAAVGELFAQRVLGTSGAAETLKVAYQIQIDLADEETGATKGIAKIKEDTDRITKQRDDAEKELKSLPPIIADIKVELDEGKIKNIEQIEAAIDQAKENVKAKIVPQEFVIPVTVRTVVNQASDGDITTGVTIPPAQNNRNVNLQASGGRVGSGAPYIVGDRLGASGGAGGAEAFVPTSRRRASGGDVQILGQNGPEFFVPPTDGIILNAQQTRALAGYYEGTKSTFLDKSDVTPNADLFLQLLRDEIRSLLADFASKVSTSGRQSGGGGASITAPQAAEVVSDNAVSSSQSVARAIRDQYYSPREERASLGNTQTYTASDAVRDIYGYIIGQRPDYFQNIAGFSRQAAGGFVLGGENLLVGDRLGASGGAGGAETFVPTSNFQSLVQTVKAPPTYNQATTLIDNRQLSITANGADANNTARTVSRAAHGFLSESFAVQARDQAKKVGRF